MKFKLFLLVCFVGALCFSCDDDNDDIIDLVAGKMSMEEVKAGDELTITGTGFSTVKNENLVKLNDLILSIEEATASELKIVIPEEATTGNVTVTVDEKSVDFGELKVLKERLFVLKSNYDEQFEYIIEIDAETGEESVFMELPWSENTMYSSLTYIGSSNNLLLVSSPDWQIKNYKILSIDIETKSITEKEFESATEIEWVGIVTDNENDVYVYKNINYWDNDKEERVRKSEFFKLDLESGKEDLVTVINDFNVINCGISKDLDKIFIAARKDHDDGFLLSLNLADKQVKEISLGMTSEFINVVVSDEDVFLLNEVERYNYKLLELNLNTEKLETIVDLPGEEYYYSYPCFLGSTNEIISFREDNYDTMDKVCKINLDDNNFSMIDFVGQGDDWFHETLAIFL